MAKLFIILLLAVNFLSACQDTKTVVKPESLSPTECPETAKLKKELENSSDQAFSLDGSNTATGCSTGESNSFEF